MNKALKIILMVLLFLAVAVGAVFGYRFFSDRQTAATPIATEGQAYLTTSPNASEGVTAVAEAEEDNLASDSSIEPTTAWPFADRKSESKFEAKESVGYTTTKAVHVSKRPHGIGDYRVSIVVFVGEIVAVDASIQSSRVEYLQPVGELIEHSRTGTAVVAVHDSVHHQFTDRPFRIIIDGFLAENGHRHGTIGCDSRLDECVNLRQNGHEASFEHLLVYDFRSLCHSCKSDELDVIARQKTQEVLAEKNHPRIGGAVVIR